MRIRKKRRLQFRRLLRQAPGAIQDIDPIPPTNPFLIETPAQRERWNRKTVVATATSSERQLQLLARKNMQKISNKIMLARLRHRSRGVGPIAELACKCP